MREILQVQAGQCGNQIGTKVHFSFLKTIFQRKWRKVNIIKNETKLIQKIQVL